jgi:hypothetical protein
MMIMTVYIYILIIVITYTICFMIMYIEGYLNLLDSLSGYVDYTI